MKRPCRALVRRAFGSTFSDDEIEDLYSDAWVGTLRTLKTRHVGLTDDEIKSYLFTAVANHASKRLRTRKRKPTATLDEAGAIADVSRSPEEEATGLEQTRQTRDLLASLPPRRRAVMYLRYGWGLEPKQVCGLIEGLSPRAYRKEITRGVDDLINRLELLESGQWCRERLGLMKTYAAGSATQDQARQAEHHLSHCRSCADLVGRIHSGLGAIGPAMGAPMVIDQLGFGSATPVAKLGELAERVTDLAGAGAGPAGQLGSMRGAGAAGSGVLAKLAGIGGGSKLAAACLGGGLAATACVAVGVGPVGLGKSDHDRSSRAAVIEPVEIPAPDPSPVIDPVPTDPVPVPDPSDEKPAESGQDLPKKEPVVDPETPAADQEFGVVSAAAPGGGGGGGGSSGAAVGQEFGP